VDRTSNSEGKEKLTTKPCEAVQQSNDAKLASPSKAMPLFSYSLSKPNQREFGCITSADEIFHRIGDVEEFYATLGYTQEMRKQGVIPDEFIWERYTRDGAVMSATCVQAHIATYLHKHSHKFRGQYGHAYAMTAGTCSADCLDASDKDCVDCSRHPPIVSEANY
jgi:hypothetical protein